MRRCRGRPGCRASRGSPGSPDDRFGMTSGTGVDGSALSLRGPLDELRRT
jgi:hypothetical protein